MDMVLNRDVEALIVLKRLSAAASATAGGAGNNTAVTGAVIDRAQWAQGLPLSLDAIIAFEATLAATKTLSLAWTLNDSADGVNFAAYASGSAAVVATGPTGGATVVGEYKISASLSSARRYLRLDFTPNLSATSTDTAAARAVGAFAGFQHNPAPNN